MIKRIFLLLLLIPLCSFSQYNNFKDAIQNKLIKYTANYPEKIYLQTDKPYYTIGDDIWFSAYLINGISLQKTIKSRIVYVELINDQDSILSKKRLFVEDISTAGDFKINKNWKEGKYLLRAYTNYMRNQDSDYFFQKEIQIWNINSKESENPKSTNTLNENNLEVGFYPEGGYLINGIKSKIGIKVKNIGDNSVEGVIRNSDNDTIISFKTYNYGLGVVAFTPETNKSYHAIVNYNNQEFTYQLPKALTQGYNLNIENRGDEILVRANSNTTNGLKGSYLLVHQRGKIVSEVLETDVKNTYTIKLKTNALFDGVVNFVLFDNNGRPTAERLVFVNNQTNDVKVNINRNLLYPEKRTKVGLNIDLTDQNGNPISGNLSLSITDLNVIENNQNTENIKSYFLLNSDLRGQIKDPGYFFTNEKDFKRRYLLDIVMLTHGWRRFKWTEIENSTIFSNQFKPEQGIYITGHTADLKSTAVRIPAYTRLTFKGYEILQENQKADRNGSFKYGPYMIIDSLPTLIEARVQGFKNKDKKNRNVTIYVDEKKTVSPSIKRPTYLKAHQNNDTIVSNFLEHSKLAYALDSKFMESARLLDEVLIIGKKKTEQDKRDELLDEKADYGYPTRRLDLNDLPNSQSSSVYDLLYYIPGITIHNDSVTLRRRTPRIIVDGLTYESSDIAHLSGNDIEFIDVLEGADASFFSNSGNGVIFIHLKDGSNIIGNNVKRKPGIIDFMVKGFYAAREFYAPNHLDNFEEVLKQDIRSTLHWEPIIDLTDSNTRAKISFFTSDTESSYSIKIEGITDSGIPILHYSTFNVE